jgi:hypothetical protein
LQIAKETHSVFSSCGHLIPMGFDVEVHGQMLNG